MASRLGVFTLPWASAPLVVAHVVPALVVGHAENDVRAGLSRGNLGRRAAQGVNPARIIKPALHIAISQWSHDTIS